MPIETNVKYICDGCGSDTLVPPGKQPDAWVEIQITNVSKIHNQIGFDKSAHGVICPNCAKLIADRSANAIGFQEVFTSYERVFASRPVLTVDAIVTKLMNSVPTILMIRRKNRPFGWALPGGLVDKGETTEQAVVRELKEETGLEGISVSFFKISSEPGRDPRFHSVSICYEVSVRDGNAMAADDAADCGWFSYDEILELDVAFDHKKIITDCFKKRSEHTTAGILYR